MHPELLRKLLLKYNHHSRSLSDGVSNESGDDLDTNSNINDYEQNIRISRAMMGNDDGVLFVRALDDTPGRHQNPNDDVNLMGGGGTGLDGGADAAADNGLDNPFLVNRSQRNGLRRLFLSTDPDEAYEASILSSSSSLSASGEIEFNSDTKIAFLGGLTIWQLTALVIAFIMFACKRVCFLTIRIRFAYYN